MKKGICLSCIPGEAPAEKMTNAAKLGFECVEFPTLRSAEDREMHASLAAENAITVRSIMNMDHWGKPLSDVDPDVRKQSVDGIAQSIDTAVAVGASTVLVVPAVVNDDVTYEQAWERSVESLKSILPYAEEKGVDIAIENVWNKFLLSPIEFVQYIDSFESKFLTAYFDVGNIVAYGVPQHWIRSLGSRLSKIHIKGFDYQTKAWVQLLEGSINWSEVMAALKDVGYDDVITAELSPAGDDKIAGLERISQDMDTIFASQHVGS